MISLAAAVALTLAAYAAPEEKEPPTKAALAAITQRGRDLAGYDRAAWHAAMTQLMAVGGLARQRVHVQVRLEHRHLQ